MISIVSVIAMEILSTLDGVLTHGIQYAIGVLTVIYLLKKIKQINNNYKDERESD